MRWSIGRKISSGFAIALLVLSLVGELKYALLRKSAYTLNPFPGLP
jgi:CHASE3 domain sensor protein